MRIINNTGNEMLLVWNMYAGSFDLVPILYLDRDSMCYIALLC